MDDRPSPAFLFRTFAPDGACRLTVRPTAGLLRTQDELVPVLDALGPVLRSAGATSARLVLRVEDAAATVVDLHPVPGCILVARLLRDSADGILVAVADAGGIVGPSEIDRLHEVLVGAMPTVNWSDVMDWLTGCAPPLAALVYATCREGDHSLNTVALCLSSEFFAASAGDNLAGTSVGHRRI